MKHIKNLLLVIGWLGLGLLFPWLVLGPFGTNLEHLWSWGAAHLPAILQRWLQPGLMHVFLFTPFILAGGLLFKMAWSRLGRGMALLITALGYGLVYKAACFLPEISNYPFSLGWSEASRYYYASLYLGERIYGIQAPLSILHPSRYLMQAIPFLLSNSPLWLHRAWQVLLWLVTSGLTGWLVAHRVGQNQSGLVRLALAIGAILFLFQGPVLPPAGDGYSGAVGVQPAASVAHPGGGTGSLAMGGDQPGELAAGARVAGLGDVFSGDAFLRK